MGIRKVLQGNFDFEIIDEFLDHFSMISEILENLVIQLENPKHYEQNINELFRIFHNLKSATAYLEIKIIHSFAIFIEDLLDKMRNESGPAETKLVDWLLLCCDQLTVWKDNLLLDEELALLPEILKKLPTI